jgi:hypothetical protein
MFRSSGSAGHAVLSHLCSTKEPRQATGRELHTGPPPDHSTVLDVLLVTGRTVKARIGPFYAEGGTRRGTPVSFVTEVYADEI